MTMMTVKKDKNGRHVPEEEKEKEQAVTETGGTDEELNGLNGKSPETPEAAAADAENDVSPAQTENGADECKNGERAEEDEKGSPKKEKDAKIKKLSAKLRTAESKIETLEKEAADGRDRYTRLAAEYENYRKRTQRELEGRYSDGKADAWKSLLDTVDNFERALSRKPEDAETDGFYKGMELTYKQLREQMKAAGVVEIEAMGAEFDPELHNAVMHCEDEEAGENTVVQVFVKGYTLNGKVLRHSMVKVAN